MIKHFLQTFPWLRASVSFMKAQKVPIIFDWEAVHQTYYVANLKFHLVFVQKVSVLIPDFLGIKF